MSSSAATPAVPNYQPTADASDYAANAASETQEQQLIFAQQQYADQKPITEQYMNSMIANSDAQTQEAQQQAADAQQDRSTYESTYQPIEQQFATEASNYNSPDRANQNAGAAEADVATAFGAARANATQNLESYGVDPSQTRYGALDLGSRISQAAATATAGTTSRLATYQEGLQLQGQAINIGRGYSNDVTNEYGGSGSAYAGAANSGQQGISAANSTNSTYDTIEGTPTQYAGLANADAGTAVNAMGSGFNANSQVAQMQNQQSQSNSQGIGTLVGVAATVGIAI